jgi:hypothetical protein
VRYGTKPSALTRNGAASKTPTTSSPPQQGSSKFSLFVMRHYGFGVDPDNKKGIHKNLGSSTMIKY